ncbi:Guanidinopropionase [bacterium HR39]|nr:Guanidinopropionase [bacterium HR39]
MPRYEPAFGMDVPRFAGIATFMKLPHVRPEEAEGVEIGILGVPFDLGTTNRPGARFGPRALREAASMLRRLNQATGVDPFALAACADLGDAPVNPADLQDSLRRIEAFLDGVVGRGIVPLVAGGDHLTSLPVLRALARRHGPLGMVHFDAHTDFYDAYFGGFRYTHGTPFRRAAEEGLIDPRRVVQIGIRVTLYDGEDVRFARSAGVRIVPIEELVDRGFAAVMAEARAVVGTGPVYASFDIDAIDPSQAPGTGTPEVGGIDVHSAQRMIRLLDGLDLVGADLVEVSPSYDMGGLTAWTGANLMFELLCVLARAAARRRADQASS